MSRFQYHYRAQECIAQGALTNSKRPESLVMGIYPTHVVKGHGCYIWDTEGRRYIDYICGLGSSLFGYGNETMKRAVKDQLDNFGPVLSLPTVREVETAETLKKMFPFVDAVKFLKSGTEACIAAVRIARAKTGMDLVLSEGYHGWSDGFIGLMPPALGIPKTQHFQKLTDDSDLTNVAAVIIEPIITNMSPERIAWLHQLREKCTLSGTMLIFDEIITGFRFPKFSVSSFLGIDPDLICLGKAIAGGLPLSAVGGKYDVMNCAEYFVSSTFAGDTLALNSCKALMEAMLKGKYDIQMLWVKGQQFLDKFNTIWPEMIRIDGYPTRGVFAGDPMVKALLWQEACKAGVLFGPSWWINFPLVEESDNVIGICTEILGRIQQKQVNLEGTPPRSPFAERARQ